jgi:GntR family transcriptional regulator, phosphonate transport system regulatory protein
LAKQAIWAAIAASLSEEIAAGHYRPGDRLPTEAALAARFGVNRHTVRHALAALAERGLVHSRQGAGAFVAQRPTEYPLGRRVRFHQNVLAAGQTPSRRIRRSETRAGDAEEARVLRLKPGDAVHVIEGVSLADGQPIAAFRSIFPAARFPGLLEALRETRSITQALGSLGLTDYTRAETRLTAQLADPVLALALGVRAGTPVMRTVAVNVDPNGVPVELGTTWFAGERVTLTVADQP